MKLTFFALALSIGFVHSTGYNMCSSNSCGNSYHDTNCGCPAVFVPVCGRDGNSYMNKCAAKCAGVRVKKDGMCHGYYGNSCDYNCLNQPIQPVCGSNSITYGNSCFSQCRGQGFNQQFECAPISISSCGSDIRYVCGSDYRTYSSSCACQASGVQVLHIGKCLLNGSYGFYNQAGSSSQQILLVQQPSAVLGMPSNLLINHLGGSVYPGLGGQFGQIGGLGQFGQYGSIGQGQFGQYGQSVPFGQVQVGQYGSIGQGQFGQYGQSSIGQVQVGQIGQSSVIGGQSGPIGQVQLVNQFPYGQQQQVQQQIYIQQSPQYPTPGYPSQFGVQAPLPSWEQYAQSFFNLPTNNGLLYCNYQNQQSQGYMCSLPGLRTIPSMPTAHPSFNFRNCPSAQNIISWLYPNPNNCPFDLSTLFPRENFNYGGNYPCVNSFFGGQQYGQPSPYGYSGYQGYQGLLGAQIQVGQTSYQPLSQFYNPMAPIGGQYASTTFQSSPIYSNGQQIPGMAAPAQGYAQAAPAAPAPAPAPSAPASQPAVAPFSFDSLTQSTVSSIPKDLADMLLKAPYVYYTYFYTIVYYKIAKPETKIQGVSIKDMMFFISQHTIKSAPKKAEKEELTVFQSGIGTQFDVSNSFDIVNNILNELSAPLSLGSQASSSGSSSSDLTLTITGGSSAPATMPTSSSSTVISTTFKDAMPDVSSSTAYTASFGLPQLLGESAA